MQNLILEITFNRNDIKLIGGTNAPTGFKYKCKVSGVIPEIGVQLDGGFFDTNEEAIIPEITGQVSFSRTRQLTNAFTFVIKDTSVFTESEDGKVFTIDESILIEKIKEKFAEGFSIQVTDIS
jgi:hypothetical protein